MNSRGVLSLFYILHDIILFIYVIIINQKLLYEFKHFQEQVSFVRTLFVSFILF